MSGQTISPRREHFDAMAQLSLPSREFVTEDRMPTNHIRIERVRHPTNRQPAQRESLYGT